jgi:3-oxoadipate enol-lactonase
LTVPPRDEGRLELADGGFLHYEVAGEGPWVTLLHPGLWDSRTWDAQFEAWSDRFRLLRYDFRGYGRSSRLSGSPYSHVRDLIELLDSLEILSTALIGCSMGGGVEIDFTLEHPDRVTALVAVASALGGFEPLEEEEDWWDERFAPVEAAVEAGDIERAEELQLEIWAPMGTDDPAGRRIRDIAFDNIHEVTMDESAEEELEPPAATRLGEIDVPTLVLIADHDPPFSRRCGELIAREVLDGRAVTIVADHVINLRNPEAFEVAVLPFLVETTLG